QLIKITSQMNLTKALLLVSIFTTAFSGPTKDVEFRSLETRQGVINGSREHALNGREFYSFRGIPFAKSPTGERRFKNPEAATNWSGVRNGSWIAPECLQPDFNGFYNTTSDEDCLYLNVFTPLNEPPVAVMVYIHGGGYIIGGMRSYQPNALLTQNVLLVTIQYRLGFLGFLSTEDEVAPGNLGLKDQTQALRWVKNNIQDYGGDPNRVTIFGESSGGRAAHLQMLTPASRGLFSRVILQSGTAIVPGTTQISGFREQAEEFGQRFNCSLQGAESSESFNSTNLISCLQQLPASNFIKGFENQIKFGVRVDGDYLPASPEQLLKSGDYHKCDIIAGFTQHEGATSVMFADLQNKPEFITDPIYAYVGDMFNMEKDDPELGDLITQAVHYYTGSRSLNISQERYDQTVRLLTSLISLPHDQTIQMHARDTLYGRRVFAYELKHKGQYIFLQFLTTQYDDVYTDNWVHHGDDLMFLFTTDITNRTLMRPDDIKMREIMVKLWTNFAKHGDPTPDGTLGFKWSPVSLLSQRQQLVLKPEPYMEINDRCKDFEFWQSLPRNASFIISEHKCNSNVMCLLQ
ncbi:unnamed protein product, partial [Meganyctiphanes norvegica]